ncbi:hypothetical protein KUCAC02_008982 [Chaenocephalus aceratus]|uniref:Uncharacterized protein n=1 Tax=Chaenocephalus aceratus TaxID=36190 RepID=A0ACB9WTP2_CHAAC|nr:hypothetical protein KUCAC02_008982 [Chaenocephalus aceratus]
MAIQQADKLLKKHKDLHCAKVGTKAIGLQRTGKQDEAFTLAQEVATLEPTDDNSLQAMTILYREMHQYKKMQQAGMALYKIVPKNPYYFWSVMSLVMQAISAQDEKRPKPCSCLWLNAWWRKWSRRRRLKQKQRSSCIS